MAAVSPRPPPYLPISSDSLKKRTSHLDRLIACTVLHHVTYTHRLPSSICGTYPGSLGNILSFEVMAGTAHTLAEGRPGRSGTNVEALTPGMSRRLPCSKSIGRPWLSMSCAPPPL